MPSALSRLLAQLRDEQRSCVAVAAALAQALEIPEPHDGALRRVAADADVSGLSNAYHNPAHTRDVTVTWANLAVLNNRLAEAGGAPVMLGRVDLALGLYAALGHDLLHDGIGNTVDTSAGAMRIPFRLERMAADHVSRLLQASGITAELVAPVADAIMTTDMIGGLAALEHGAAGVADPAYPALPSLVRPAWRCLAEMLRDADLLASVALTAADHDRQSLQLGQEVGGDVTSPGVVEEFFQTAAAERFRSPAGALFLPQFHALRAINHARAEGAGWLSLEAAAHRLAGPSLADPRLADP